MLATLLTLAGCAPRTSIYEIDVRVACVAFPPIHYSRHDTDGTIVQARDRNAAWDALCAPRPAEQK